MLLPAAVSADEADVDRDRAVVALAGRVVVRQRELLGAEDERLHGGVGRVGRGGLVVLHDGVHDRVAELVHLRVGEVVGALGAAACAGAGLVRHPADELDARDGVFLGAARLLHDLRHGDVEVGELLGLGVGDGRLGDELGRRGGARGHAITPSGLANLSDEVNLWEII